MSVVAVASVGDLAGGRNVLDSMLRLSGGQRRVEASRWLVCSEREVAIGCAVCMRACSKQKGKGRGWEWWWHGGLRAWERERCRSARVAKCWAGVGY
jgi:hypothetical protein